MFESITQAKVKDCIIDEKIDEKIVFIIEKGDMGLAIGKHGANFKRIEAVLKKQIRLIEFDDNLSQFIKNCIYPVTSVEITQNEKKVIIKGNDFKSKAMIIGRDKATLKKTISIVKRFFDIDDITVI